jgi:hypothetical protein
MKIYRLRPGLLFRLSGGSFLYGLSKGASEVVLLQRVICNNSPIVVKQPHSLLYLTHIRSYPQKGGAEQKARSEAIYFHIFISLLLLVRFSILFAVSKMIYDGV